MMNLLPAKLSAIGDLNASKLGDNIRFVRGSQDISGLDERMWLSAVKGLEQRRQTSAYWSIHSI